MSAGGIIWSVVAAASIGESVGALAATAANANAIAADVPQVSPGPYRPAQWSQTALTFITLPGSVTPGSQIATSNVGQVAQPSAADPSNSDLAPGTFGSYTLKADSAVKAPVITPDTIYVFDAVIRMEHFQELRATEHPVQNGANISDHAFIMPSRVVMEIGMSDVMDSFTPGDWTSSSSKSVAAYQTLVELQQGRQPLIVTTRLATYNNMLIESIRADDTHETRYSLKATVTFKQIFLATVTTQQVSARSQMTDSTSIGSKQPLPVPPGILKNNQVLTPTSVPGAGTFSSVPITGS
ncbi:MAG: phage baseplate protein [Acidobacteriaceae bacterium]